MVLSATLVLTASGVGLNGSGAISVPGAKVGDWVACNRSDTAGTSFDVANTLERTVSVANQVQQLSSGNLTSVTLYIFLFRSEVAVASV